MPPFVVPISTLGAIQGTTILFTRNGVRFLAAVLKVSFQLVHEGVAVPRAPSKLDLVERKFAPFQSLEAFVEVVPFVPRPEVVMVGHARPPNGQSLPAIPVRLALVRDKIVFDKTLFVYGDREFEGAYPRPFSAMPLVFDRARATEENPVGIMAPGAPNIVDPEAPSRMAGFGPLPAAWPTRKRHFGGTLPVADQEGFIALPAEFPFEFFQVSPPDQRVAELFGDEWIIVEGVHEHLERIACKLPGPRVVAALSDGTGAVKPIELTCDTLSVDADNFLATLIYRGHVPLYFTDLRSLSVNARLELRGGLDAPPFESPETPSRREDSPLMATASTPQLTVASSIEDDDTPEGIGGYDSALPFQNPRGAAQVAPPQPGAGGGETSARVFPPSAPPPVPRTPSSISAPETPLLENDEPSKPKDSPMRLVPPPPRVNLNPPTPAIVPAEVRESATAFESSKAAAQATLGDSLRLERAPSVDDASKAALGTAPTPIPSPVAPPVASNSSPIPPAVVASPRQTSADAVADPVSAAVTSSPSASPTLSPSPSPPVVSEAPAETGLRRTVMERLGRNEALYGIDLAKADLSGLNLERAALSGCNLAGANLRGTNLKGARLSGAKLHGAELTDAILDEAELDAADLSRANLTQASFRRAKAGDANFSLAVASSAHFDEMIAKRVIFAQTRLDNATFAKADLAHAELSGAELDGTVFDDASLVGARLLDTRGAGLSAKRASLDDATLVGVTLKDADMTGLSGVGSVWERASLSSCRFDDANLARVSFVRASLMKSSFVNAKMDEANLTGSTGEESVFDGAKLDGGDLRQSKHLKASFIGASLGRVNAQKVILTQARLQEAKARSANLRGARLKGADLTEADLKDADLRDTDLDGATMTGAHVEGAKFAGASLRGTVDGPMPPKEE